MSLILALSTPALADRVLWVSPPDDASSVAVARTVPGATSAPLDSLVTGGQPPPDAQSLAILRSELGDVRKLADEFDGELQIMARLAKATEDVHLLRTEEDRNLLQRALLFEGFAVHRYFQAKLGSEAAAEPYRTGSGDGAQVTSWLDACALLAAPTTPAKEDIPEQSERLAFDEAQAACRVMPSATFILGDLAAGAEVRFDGVKIEGGKGVRVRVVPGRHLFHVAVGDTVLLAGDTRIKAGADVTVSAPFGPTELADLRKLVDSGADGWTVPASAMMPVQGIGEPVYIAVPNGERTVLWRVDGGVATRQRIEGKETPTGLKARLTLGGGWVSTGDFLLQNLDDGATADRYTVNAGTPAGAVSVSYEGALWSVGVGVDAQLALGQYHSLPTGDADTSVFLYPHVEAGLPWVQATIGPMFPWYLGVGAQGRLPLFKPVELFAAGVYGIPMDRARDEGEPTFEPLPAYAAWGGATVRIGR